MNLLLITVRSDYGGGPRHVEQLIQKLPENVNLFMAYPEIGEPYAALWNKNKRIVGTLFIPYRRFSFKALLRLKRFVSENKIDIVHSHGNGAGLYSRLLKVFCPQLRVVHTYHGISDVYSSKVKSLLSKLIGIALSPWADLYVCVSHGEKQMALVRKFSKDENTVVIFNGIVDPHFIKKREANQSPFRIVTLSRFDYQKNMDSMFRIAAQWAGLENIRFVWVGDGEDKERLEQQARAEDVPIDFIGFTTDPMKYLLSSDLYISTSRFEGLPYGLIEATSVGLPIVASNVKGNNEVVVPGYNGFLFKEESEAVNQIETMINDKAKYKQMSEAAVEFFKKNFTEEKMVEALLMEYKKLAK